MEENKFLGFQNQDDETSCGAYCTGHTLNLVGIPNEIDDVYYECETDEDEGTDPDSIIAALKNYGCRPHYKTTQDNDEAKSFIDENLAMGNPVILSVNYFYDEDDPGHWFVCAGKYKDKYVIIDSDPADEDKEIVDTYTWKELEDRFVWFEEYGTDDDWYYEFDMIAVEPKRTPSCVNQMDKIYPDLYEDEDLRKWWGYYLDDLLEISENNFGDKEGYILLSDLINENYDNIIDLGAYWFEEIDQDDLEYELNNYLLLAEGYKLSVPEKKKEEALLSFYSALIGTLLYYY